MRADCGLFHKERQHSGHPWHQRAITYWTMCFPAWHNWQKWPWRRACGVCVLPTREKLVRRTVYLTSKPWKRTCPCSPRNSPRTPLLLLMWTCFGMASEKGVLSLLTILFLLNWRRRNLAKHGATLKSVACREEINESSWKHVLSRNRIAARKSRKKPSKHAEVPMMITSPSG